MVSNLVQCLDEMCELRNENLLKIKDNLSDRLIHSGEYEVLEILCNVKALQKILEELIREAMPVALDEISRFPGGRGSINGVMVEEREVGVKYDYSGDDVYDALISERKSIDAEIKGREIVLRNSGNCTKRSTSSVIVTFR